MLHIFPMYHLLYESHFSGPVCRTTEIVDHRQLKANEARLTQLLKYHTVRGEPRNVGRVIVCYSYIGHCDISIYNHICYIYIYILYCYNYYDYDSTMISHDVIHEIYPFGKNQKGRCWECHHNFHVTATIIKVSNQT